MSTENTTEEKVTIEEVMKRLVDISKDSSSRITRLEGQTDEIVPNVGEYREQNANAVKEEVGNLLEKNRSNSNIEYHISNGN